ncbi:9478_t:CDS:2, partial [Acaulospora colombiana]
EAAETPDPDANNEDALRICRILIWTHHLLSLEKRKNVCKWAEELGIWGYSKPGYPGIIIAEGLHVNVQEYISRLKKLNWQAITVRSEEAETIENASLQNYGEYVKLRLGRDEPGISEIESMSEISSRCCNELTEIPAEIGYMKNLQTLDVSENQLECIPDTIGFLHKLTDLKLSKNQLTTIPSSIGSLKKLGTLLLNNNKITELPPEIGQIKTLVNLDIRENPITVLPAELGRLQYLRKLLTDGCPLVTEFVHQITHSPPTLMELAARTIVRLQVPILEDTTDHIKDYLASAKKCSFCGGPYFESYVKRGKIIDKNDNPIPLEYRLCCPHWNTEQERVSLLFCALPDTAPSPEPYKHQRHQVANEKPYDGNASFTHQTTIVAKFA